MTGETIKRPAADEQLVDIRDVKIDRALPAEERIRSFVEQIRDPYKFRVGDVVVEVSFADTQNTITDNFINMIASMQHFRPLAGIDTMLWRRQAGVLPAAV